MTKLDVKLGLSFSSKFCVAKLDRGSPLSQTALTTESVSCVSSHDVTSFMAFCIRGMEKHEDHIRFFVSTITSVERQ